VTPTRTSAALQAEALTLAAVARGLSEADLSRPSPCPPWTNSGLLGHVVIAAGRVDEALVAARADGPDGPLVSARGYYRRDHRFSPAVNDERIKVAADLAVRLRTAAAIGGELEAASEHSLTLLLAAAPDQEVRTRHGDRMLLADFAITRVVELAIHGLDLARGLGRPAWLTPEATTVLDDLLAPGGLAGALQVELGCTSLGLIERLTGRTPLSAVDSAVLARNGLSLLPLG
jgi:uncharacterized protein (TIGR03083 family)